MRSSNPLTKPPRRRKSAIPPLTNLEARRTPDTPQEQPESSVAGPSEQIPQAGLPDANPGVETDWLDGDDLALLNDAANADEDLKVPEDADHVFGKKNKYNPDPQFTFGVPPEGDMARIREKVREEVWRGFDAEVELKVDQKTKKLVAEYAAKKEEMQQQVNRYQSLSSQLRQENKKLNASTVKVELETRNEQLKHAKAHIAHLQNTREAEIQSLKDDFLAQRETMQRENGKLLLDNQTLIKSCSDMAAQQEAQQSAVVQEKDQFSATSEIKKQELKTLQTQLAEKNAAFETGRMQYEDVVRQLAESQQALAQQTTQVNEVNIQLRQQSTTLSHRGAELSDATQQASRLSAEKADLEARLNTAGKTLKDAIQEGTQLVSDKADLERRLNEGGTALDGATQEAKRLANEKADLERRLNEAQTTFEDATRGVRELLTEKADLERRLQEAGTLLEDATQQSSRLANEKAELERRLAEANSAKQQKQQLSDQYSILETHNRNLREENDGLLQRLAKLKESAEEQRYHDQEIIDHLEDTRAEHLNKIEELNAEVVQVKKSNAEKEELIIALHGDAELKKDQIETLETDQTAQQTRISEAKARDEASAAQLELLTTRVIELEKETKQAEVSRKKQEQLRIAAETELDALRNKVVEKNAELEEAAYFQSAYDQLNEQIDEESQLAAQAIEAKELLEKENEKLEAKNLDLRRQVADLETVVKRKDAQLKKTEAQLGEKDAELGEKGTLLEEKNTELEEKKAQLEAMQMQSPTRSEFEVRHDRLLSEELEDYSNEESPSLRPTSSGRISQVLDISRIMTTLDQRPVEEVVEQTSIAPAISAPSARPEYAADNQPITSVWEEEFNAHPAVKSGTESATPPQALSFSDVKTIVSQEPVEGSQPPVHQTLERSAVATTIDQAPIEAVSQARDMSDIAIQTDAEVQTPVRQPLTFTGIKPVLNQEPIEVADLKTVLASSGTQTTVQPGPTLASTGTQTRPQLPMPPTIIRLPAQAPALPTFTKALIGISALLVLLFSILVAGYFDVSQQRALWLGANELTRQSVIRLRRSYGTGMPSGWLGWCFEFARPLLLLLAAVFGSFREAVMNPKLFLLASGSSYGDSMSF